MPKGSNKPASAHAMAPATVRESGSKSSPQALPTPAKTEKNPAAVALGRLGGKKGGPARAQNLSPKRRKEIAQKAARARWRQSKPSS